MDNKTIYDKTPKGEQELRSKSAALPEDIGHALQMVDGISTFGEISRRAVPGQRRDLAATFEELEKGGYIVDRTRSVSVPKMAVPVKAPIPSGNQARAGAELDFTAAARAPGPEATRSTSATVLFFDVVGYTKLPVNKQIEIKQQFNQLVSDSLRGLGDDERIVLDTGDGAAIGFLQHPEDALEAAMKFRKALLDKYLEYPELKVRLGIHLGPINIVRDVTGRSNMVGDGINDAQRVMSFAGANQIYISRPYYDFVSRLTDEYAELFRYRGSQTDKHGREHQIYELVDTEAPVSGEVPAQAAKPAEPIKFEPFNIELPAPEVPAAAPANEEPEIRPEELELISDIDKFKIPGNVEQPGAARQQPAPPLAPPQETVKPVAQAQMPSGEEVEKFAAEQTRAWNEAGQRAIETARSKAEHAIQPPSKAGKREAGGRQSAQVWRWHRGKVWAGLATLLLIALLAVPYVLPTQRYATDIEQLLADRLQQPAHVGRLDVRLLPVPHFDLGNVSLGETKQFQAQRARVNFAWSALFASNERITGIELEGAQVNGAALQQVAGWLLQIAADDRHPVARIELNKCSLVTEEFQLSGIGGEMVFGQDGKISRAKLHAEENRYALEIDAAPGNKATASITLRGGALPLLPHWTFDELNAKGELGGDELVITELFGRIMGGVVRGDARINWRSGWRVQGNLTAQAVTLAHVTNTLAGDMEGKASFEMQSPAFPGLADTAHLNGTFVIRQGNINGVNLVETARLRSAENLPGGRTHFDSLSGVLEYAGGAYHFAQVRMSAGALNAAGTLDVADGRLSGRVDADLTRLAGMGKVPLQIGGTVANPTLRAALVRK